ncbi:carboxypeptidase-like regulatory domain-containing protein [Leptobacterium flavescens]|nr:carboxypeptidase-like regulatory domain-containing protein [Leptobacterium flavescens]
MKKLILLLCLALVSCDFNDGSNDDDLVCTAQFVYGLVVTVKDASTGEDLEGVTITAIDGEYEETLMESGPGPVVYLGAGERPGNYTLTIQKEGFQTIVSTFINVTADVCHVVPQELSFNLQPN